MVFSKQYAVCYPSIIHPLVSEKYDLKFKYICLLKYYADKHRYNDQAILYRIITLSNMLIGKTDLSEMSLTANECNEAMKSIMKTRFAPIKFFSYQFVFLFDIIFIMAVDNQKLGDDICAELKSTVTLRHGKALEEMKNKMYAEKSDFAHKKMISEEMVEAWNNTRKYCRSLNRNITFTATMSAGKSTLINAVIGRKLSYTKKAACTSKIIAFNTSPSKSQLINIFYGDEMHTVTTEHDARGFTKSLDKPCAVCSYFMSPLTYKKITLTDTPGVNSSQNPEHKKITRDELVSCNTDILVYVIPVSYYGSTDDFRHLTYIRKNVKYKKILFSVNMIDSCSRDDDSIDEIIDAIKRHLLSIGFESPIVCPMSAEGGMLIKRALYGLDLSENEKEACKAYVHIFQGEALPLSGFYPKAIRQTVSADISWLQADVDMVWNAYENTGIPGFETLLYKITEEE
ncbi:MAG: dynamin family protein [Prevotella sp.]|nr:dynamin family protein [Prevotella sp.]